MKATNVLCVLMGASLSGCYIGPGGICGPQTPIYYCQSKADQEKMRPKPYGAHWVKEGMTRESRREDSWACGAARTEHGATKPVFPKDQLKAAKLPTDLNDILADSRLTKSWANCMQSKGYVYIDSCGERCLYP
jgi:hypothetical protein